MTREIHKIPPSPRAVRWRAVLWYWWPLAFSGFMLGIYGGLITLMTFLASQGKPLDDEFIGKDPKVVKGKVTRIQGGELDERGNLLPIRLSYKFKTLEGREITGRGFLDAPDVRIGDEIDIEYAALQNSVSRPKGGKIFLGPRLYVFFLWTMLVPGVACLLFWFFGVLRVRRVLQRGDVSVVEVKAIETLRFVLPTMYRVAYTYRDHHAVLHTESHWVRARSELGQRLTSDPTSVAIAHTRSGRGTSRLVIAEDFVVQQAGLYDPSHTRNS